MPEANVKLTVRHPSATISIIDIQGDVSAFAEAAMMEAYAQASAPTTRAIILNFSGLDFMNSSGIALLLTLLGRTNQEKRHLFAYGLSEHYVRIFELTQLSHAIGVCADEAEAVASAALV